MTRSGALAVPDVVSRMVGLGYKTISVKARQHPLVNDVNMLFHFFSLSAIDLKNWT